MSARRKTVVVESGAPMDVFLGNSSDRTARFLDLRDEASGVAADPGSDLILQELPEEAGDVADQPDLARRQSTSRGSKA